MIKQPDQQIHDELIKRSSQLGYKTFQVVPQFLADLARAEQ